MSLEDSFKKVNNYLDNSKLGHFLNESEFLRGRKSFYIGAAALVSTSIADLFITNTVLSNGGEELNMYAKTLLDNAGMAGLVGQKAIINQWALYSSYTSKMNIPLPILSIANGIGTVYPAISHYFSNLF